MLPGIDIYELNLNDPQAPSWAAIRQAGFSFVFQKVNEYQPDSSFSARWPEFKANGLLRGAYYLPRPNTDNGFATIDAQADTFARLCPRLLPGDFGPVLDLEDRKLYPDDTQSQHNAAYWVPAAQRLLARMETALGRQPIIYTQRSWWTGYMNGATGFDQYLLWVVDVNHATAPVLPASWTSWTWWQWHWEHSTSPMPAPFRQPADVGVDLDYFNGTLYELRGAADIGRPGVVFLSGAVVAAHSELDDHLHLITPAGTTWTDTDLGAGALPGGGSDPVLLQSSGSLFLYFRSGDALIEAATGGPTSVTWQPTDLSAIAGVRPVHDPRVAVDGDKRFVTYWGSEDVTQAALAVDATTPPATYAPCVCETSAGVAIVYRAVGGELWSIDRNNNSPTNVSAATGATRAAGTPSSFVLNDVPHIIYRGTDGMIYDLSSPAGAWRVLSVCDERMAADPVAATDGTNAAAACRAPDGMIHVATYDGNAWTCGPTIMAVAPALRSTD